ncbi:MAG TPA: glycoside hydrolase family 88 protein [Terriglobales bacterium]|nr:glycoside hydrolase family 88 protein [Terriglobales bacterium]
MAERKLLRKIYLLLLLALLFSTAAWPQPTWSTRLADSAISRWPDGRMTRGQEKLSDWAYDKSVLLAGLIELSEVTSDGKYLDYVRRAIDALVTSEGLIPSYKAEEASLDEIAMGRVLLLLYARDRDAKCFKAAQTLRHQLDIQPRTPSGGFWHKKRYPNQMWLDGLYMAEPFYGQYASLFHEQKDFDDIAHQFVLIEQHTRDPKTGLLYHAWDESRKEVWADKSTGTSPNFWARAMGWYAMALVDTIPYFPKDHAQRTELIAILDRTASAIIRVQNADSGLWYQVLNKPQAAGNYFESSAACMFAYALAKGIRLGYLDSKYRTNALRAYKSIVAHFVRQDLQGRWTLIDTVYSAGLGGMPYRDGSYEYYVHEKIGPDDPKGMGAFLLASSEIERNRKRQ